MGQSEGKKEPLSIFDFLIHKRLIIKQIVKHFGVKGKKY